MLWRGSWATRIRIGSGLILMTYVAAHLMNLAAVLISPGVHDAVQAARLWVVRSDPGTLIIGAALLAHMVLSLGKVALARTLRMPLRDAVQIGLGLIIPLILVSHVVYTRGAHEALGVNTMLGYISALIWTTWDGWMQALLVVITWVHGSIGLHMWLRATRWWRAALPWLIGIAVLIPTLAILGFVVSARVMDGLLQDPRAAQLARAAWNWPGSEGFTLLAQIDRQATWAVWAVLGTALLVFALRRIAAALSKPIRIDYIDGPSVRAPRGQTLLETSRANGVAHTALCGGRGRCTTCRVIVEDGLEDLPPRQRPSGARWRPWVPRRARGLPARCARTAPYRCSASLPPTASAVAPMPAREKRRDWPCCFWTCAALPRAPTGNCPMTWCSCSTGFLTRSCPPSSTPGARSTNIWATG